MLNTNNALARTTTVLLIVACLTLGLLTVGVLTGRWQAAPVLTGSMEPAIPAGALIVAEPRATADLTAGDVIVFHAPTTGRPATVHRIVDADHTRGRTSVTTKGDANEEADSWGALEIRANRTWVVTRVVPELGGLILAARSPLGQFIALVLLSFAAATMIDRHRSRWAGRRSGEAPPRPEPTQAAEPAPPATPLTGDAEGRRPGFVGVLVALGLLVAMASPGARAMLTDIESDSLSVSTATVAAPSGLSATANLLLGACEVQLDWTRSPTEPIDGYEVLRQPLASEAVLGGEPTPAGPFEVVLTVAGGATTSAVDQPSAELLQLNSSFRYVVRATRADWRSSDSNTADVDLLGICV